MRNFAIWRRVLVVAGLAAAGVAATCQHDVPGPMIRPAPREVSPLAPRPGPVEPGLIHHSAESVPVTPCPHATACRGGGRKALRVATGAVGPSSVPVDAAIDGPVTLPPVPDASVLHDAGTPMR